MVEVLLIGMLVCILSIIVIRQMVIIAYLREDIEYNKNRLQEKQEYIGLLYRKIETQANTFSAEELKTLSRLVHPDKHRNSDTSTRMFVKVMQLMKGSK